MNVRHPFYFFTLLLWVGCATSSYNPPVIIERANIPRGMSPVDSFRIARLSIFNNTSCVLLVQTQRSVQELLPFNGIELTRERPIWGDQQLYETVLVSVKGGILNGYVVPSTQKEWRFSGIFGYGNSGQDMWVIEARRGNLYFR